MTQEEFFRYLADHGEGAMICVSRHDNIFQLTGNTFIHITSGNRLSMDDVLGGLNAIHPYERFSKKFNLYCFPSHFNRENTTIKYTVDNMLQSYFGLKSDLSTRRISPDQILVEFTATQVTDMKVGAV